MSIIYEMTTEICWSTLWDTARKMKAKEVEQLEDIYWDKEPDTNMLKILRANYNHPLTIDQVNLIGFLGRNTLDYKTMCFIILIIEVLFGLVLSLLISV
jgi:hypothetical protein